MSSIHPQRAHVCAVVTVSILAAMFFAGWRLIGIEQHALLGCALAFSAGIFICIALSDLLPEVQFHSPYHLRPSQPRLRIRCQALVQ